MDKFVRQAIESGFTEAQAQFLHRHLAAKPHTHLAHEIIVDEAEGSRLDEALEVYDEQIEALEAGEEGEEEEGEE